MRFCWYAGTYLRLNNISLRDIIVTSVLIVVDDGDHSYQGENVKLEILEYLAQLSSDASTLAETVRIAPVLLTGFHDCSCPAKCRLEPFRWFPHVRVLDDLGLLNPPQQIKDHVCAFGEQLTVLFVLADCLDTILDYLDQRDDVQASQLRHIRSQPQAATHLYNHT